MFFFFAKSSRTEYFFFFFFLNDKNAPPLKKKYIKKKTPTIGTIIFFGVVLCSGLLLALKSIVSLYDSFPHLRRCALGLFWRSSLCFGKAFGAAKLFFGDPIVFFGVVRCGGLPLPPRSIVSLCSDLPLLGRCALHLLQRSSLFPPNSLFSSTFPPPPFLYFNEQNQK